MPPSVGLEGHGSSGATWRDKSCLIGEDDGLGSVAQGATVELADGVDAEAYAKAARASDPGLYLLPGASTNTVTSLAGLGAVGGPLGIPLGIAVHRLLIDHVGQVAFPESMKDVRPARRRG